MFDALNREHVSRRDVARDLSIPTEDRNALVFGLVVARLEARHPSTTPTEPPPEPRPKLHAV